MAGIQLVAEQLTTSLVVPGILQQLNFSQNQAKLQINNTFTPTSLNHAFIKEEYRNVNLSGFRWVHETSDTDTFGSLGLYHFVADDQTGTEIFSVNNLGNLIFNAPVFMDNLSVNGDIDMDNFGIISLRDPVAAQDAATKAYVDSVVLGGTVTLTGAVTGSGSTGTPIPTLLNKTIDAQDRDQTFRFDHSESGAGLARFIIENVFVPDGTFSSSTDLRLVNGYNYSYRFNQSTFDITPSFGSFLFYAQDSIGNTKNFFTAEVISGVAEFVLVAKTTFNSDVIFNNLSSVTSQVPINMSSQKIVNLLDPVDPQDAATRAYVDSVAGQISNPYSLSDNLTFNWSYAAPSNPSLYQFINNFADGQQDKKYQNQFLVGGRGWSFDHTIIGNSDLNGIYEIKFQGTAIPTLSPFRIEAFPFANTTIYFDGDLFLNNNIISNMADPIAATDGATKNYVDTRRLDQFAVPTAALNINNQNINNVLSLGIGTIPSANGRIQFEAVPNINKIVLYDTTGDDYNQSGFGYTAISGNFYKTTSGHRHQFYIGSNTITSLKIDTYHITVSPEAILSDPRKVVIFSGPAGGNMHQDCYIGATGTSYTDLYFRSHAPNTGGGFLWDVGASDTSSNELMRLTGTGFLGIGTSSPNEGKLQIVGGVQNIAGEDTAIQISSALNSVKFELSNTAASGKRYELKSNSTGSFEINDRTSSATRYSLNTSGDHTFTGTIFGKFPSGVVYFQNNATTTAVTANVFTKMLGTTTLASGNFFSSPVGNRLRYDGTQTENFQISAIVSVQHNQIFGATIGIAIYKNGSLVTPSRSYDYTSGSGQLSSINTLAFISLSTNDYIEIFVTCSNGATLTPTYAIMSATMC